MGAGDRTQVPCLCVKYLTAQRLPAPGAHGMCICGICSSGGPRIEAVPAVLVKMIDGLWAPRELQGGALQWG